MSVTFACPIARQDFVARTFCNRPDAMRRLRLLGVGIDDLSFEDAVALIRAAVHDPTPRSLFFVNAHTLNLSFASTPYRTLLNEADFVLGDGSGVRLAARLQGVVLRANLNGTDLIPAFMQAANADKLRYYLLGARADVLSRTVAVVRERFPGWTLSGFHHGYLGAGEADRVVAEINAFRPHLLLVGMGNPIQETWIRDHRDRLDVNLCVGVGGLFSYLSGDYHRAPLLMRRAGLEWLAVIFTQRQKWRRYVVGNPFFITRIAFEHIKRIAGR